MLIYQKHTQLSTASSRCLTAHGQTNTLRCAYGVSAPSLSMKNFRAQSNYHSLSLPLSLHGANS